MADFLAWPHDTGVTGGWLASAGILGTLLRHLNCHVTGCWRPARHHGNGLCRKHYAKGAT